MLSVVVVKARIICLNEVIYAQLGMSLVWPRGGLSVMDLTDSINQGRLPNLVVSKNSNLVHGGMASSSFVGHA